MAVLACLIGGYESCRRACLSQACVSDFPLLEPVLCASETRGRVGGAADWRWLVGFLCVCGVCGGVSRLAVVPAGLCPRCRCSCAPGITGAIRGMPAVLLGVSGVREHGCAGWVAAGAADVADSRCRVLWVLRLAIAVRVVYGVRFTVLRRLLGPAIRRFGYEGVCCGGVGGCWSSCCIGEFCWEVAMGVAGRCLAAGVVACVLAVAPSASAADVSVSSGGVVQTPSAGSPSGSPSVSGSPSGSGGLGLASSPS